MTSVSLLSKLRHALASAIVLTLGASASLSTLAQDTLKLATGQRGNWDTSIGEVGQRAGIFKKHGIVLEILYTQGAGETQQAVLSGSVDIGVATGIMGALSAYSKGAPIRIIGAETTGAGDLYWYVSSNSPIKSLKDSDGKTLAYSTNGSSTHGIVTAFMKQYDLKAKPTGTGGPPGTLTQVMSGQIDIGWAAPPFGLQQLDEGKIRVIASGNDASAFKGQTVRLLVTTASTLASKKGAIERFMKAYRETIDFMYGDPKGLQIYSEFVPVPMAVAKRTRDDFFPKESLNPDRLTGLDTIVKDAVELKFTTQQLTKEQLDTLIQIPPRH